MPKLENSLVSETLALGTDGAFSLAARKYRAPIKTAMNRMGRIKNHVAAQSFRTLKTVRTPT